MYRLFLTILAILTTALASQAAPIITVYPSIAPNIFSSPYGDAYIANAVQGLRNGGAPTGTPGTPGFYSTTGPNVPINHMIVTNFNSWLGHLNPGSLFGPAFSNEFGNRLTFGMSAISPAGSREISLSMLEAEIVSTDSNNFLSVPREFVGGNYGPDLIGIQRNPNGTIFDILDNGELGTTPVDELYFFGYGQAFEILDTDFADPNNLTQEEFAALIADPSVTSARPFSITGNYYLGAFGGGTTVDVIDPQFIVPLPASAWIFAGAVGLLAARRRMTRKA